MPCARPASCVRQGRRVGFAQASGRGQADVRTVCVELPIAPNNDRQGSKVLAVVVHKWAFRPMFVGRMSGVAKYAEAVLFVTDSTVPEHVAAYLGITKRLNGAYRLKNGDTVTHINWVPLGGVPVDVRREIPSPYRRFFDRTPTRPDGKDEQRKLAGRLLREGGHYRQRVRRARY